MENTEIIEPLAGGGIGRALAMELVNRGCHVSLVDINGNALAETASVLSGYPVKVTEHIVDITDRKQMSALPDAVVEAHGKVNLLINNAGITLQKSFSSHTMADWERVININLWGVIYGCYYFLDALRHAEDAHIVNLSSMTGFLGLPNQSSYCATKAAVKGLSESLWAELASEGIGVTSVHPGMIKTDMIQATLKESDNVAAARRNYELVQKIGMAPEKAAKMITRAVLKNKASVRVGKDSVLLDWLKRLAPVAIHRPFVKVHKQQMLEGEATG